MKKLLIILLTISLLILCALAVNAAGETSGQCGENVTWTVEDDTIVISGTGDMYDYSEENPSPFRQHRGIYKCVIKEGVTSIGDYVFYGYGMGSMQVVVASSVSEVGSKAFASRQCRVTFLGSAPTIAPDACEDAYGQFGYIAGWEESDLQSYGGTQNWKKLDLIHEPQTKLVYDINEPIQTEDFKFTVKPGVLKTDLFSPQTIELGAYDNSTYGIKQVEVKAYDIQFTHTYFVSDGQSHLDFVKVQIDKQPQFYTGEEIKPEPVVTAGDVVLTKDVHYRVSYENNLNASAEARVTVTGIGVWEGFTKIVTFSIFRQDLSKLDISPGRVAFSGEPVVPKVYCDNNGNALKEGRDYVLYVQNNVNVGKGTCHVVGIGNYCGYATGEFEIYVPRKILTLNGAFNGYATDTQLNDQIYYEEAIVTPGINTFQVNSKVNSTWRKHYAYYELYHLVGEEFVLVTTQESEYGYQTETEFVYDFSSVYEDAAQEGGAVYMLAYSWVDSNLEVYSGAYVMLIPAKVVEATSLVVEQVEVTDDFRRVYLCAYGPDGNVGNAVWTSSNSAVATVDGGVVTFHRPGTVTVTAQYGDLVASKELVMTAQDLTQCQLVSYDLLSTSAQVYYDGYLLEEGTDYDISMSQQGDIVTFTATGRGLFTGQILREFGADGEALGHTHAFDHSCDDTCNGCDFTRSVTHQPSADWKKNRTHHYHACTLCGAQTEQQEHTLSSEDETVCTVCGLLKVPGDCNGDVVVNNEDVIYLLWHTLFPEKYVLETDGDFTKDGQVSNEDVIYLLWHTLFPEKYPVE